MSTIIGRTSPYSLLLPKQKTDLYFLSSIVPTVTIACVFAAYNKATHPPLRMYVFRSPLYMAASATKSGSGQHNNLAGGPSN